MFHETFSIDGQQLWDHVIKLARWQHPAWARGEVRCASHYLLILIFTVRPLLRSRSTSVLRNSVKKFCLLQSVSINVSV